MTTQIRQFKKALKPHMEPEILGIELLLSLSTKIVHLKDSNDTASPHLWYIALISAGWRFYI
jgi:hypothetical protein